MNKREIQKLAEDKEFLKLHLCPYCGELTSLRGAFTPCCGEPTEEVEAREWVSLIPECIIRSKNREAIK